MANTVKIRNSSAAAAEPSSLEAGELAINTADAKLFWEDSTGAIQTTYLLPAFDDLSSTAHASTHATGGSDAIAPADIGAAPAASPTFTGDVTIPDKIIHSGDSNTAIRFPAADTFTIETDGVERVRVSSDGLMTASVESTASLPVNISEMLSGPKLLIHATSDSATHSAIALRTRTTASTVANIGLGYGSGTGDGFLFFTIRTGGGTLREAMRIKSTGSVRFVPIAADPASGNEAGDVYYNSTTNKLRVYNGTAWIDLH
jgi:hypothetical protein